MSYHVSLYGLALLSLLHPLAAQTTLTATGREGSNNRITFLDSVPGSTFITPASGLSVWCVNAGAMGAAYYSDTHPSAPALDYRVVSFDTVSADPAGYYDNDLSWPEYHAGDHPFGSWAEAAFEYTETFRGTFTALVATDGYVFAEHFMQDIVSEISHESATSFGVVSDDDLAGRGNIFGSPSPENDLIDAYFAWMKTGTATLDGHIWTNSGPLYSAGYDNPDLEVLYLDRDHSSPGFELTQDYITFVPVPEPATLALPGLGMLLANRRRRPRR